MRTRTTKEEPRVDGLPLSSELSLRRRRRRAAVWKLVFSTSFFFLLAPQHPHIALAAIAVLFVLTVDCRLAVWLHVAGSGSLLYSVPHFRSCWFPFC